MSLTITFEDELAQRLEREAHERRISAEELARTILDDAVPRESARWGNLNQRRLELIRKSLREVLPEHEQSELDELQASLDSRFSDFDQTLHQQLGQLRSTKID